MIGLSNGQIDGVSQRAENAIRQAPIDFTVPPVRARLTHLDIEGKAILIIQVGPGNSVHTTESGDCYLRIGDESRRLSLAEHQELTYDRGSQTFESTSVNLTIDDLDDALLDSYRGAIGSSSNVEMLHARDLLSRRGDVIAAATLLFDARPQRDFPSAYVRVLKYDDDERGVGSEMTLLEDIRIEGPLPPTDPPVRCRRRTASSGTAASNGERTLRTGARHPTRRMAGRHRERCRPPLLQHDGRSHQG